MASGPWKLSAPQRAANCLFDSRLYLRRLRNGIRLNDLDDVEAVLRELETMLETEEAVQWRADADIRRTRALLTGTGIFPDEPKSAA